jgi:hypothetical protein
MKIFFGLEVGFDRRPLRVDSLTEWRSTRLEVAPRLACRMLHNRWEESPALHGQEATMEYVVTFVGGIGVGCFSCLLYIRSLKAKISAYEFFIHNRLDHWTARCFAKESSGPGSSGR